MLRPACFVFVLLFAGAAFPHDEARLPGDAAAVQAGVTLDVVAEIDGLALLMDAVRAGLGATVQPGAAAVREPGGHLRCIELTDALARRPNLMVSLSDEELSPAGLAARVVLEQVARQRVDAGVWPGARLYKN